MGCRATLIWRHVCVQQENNIGYGGGMGWMVHGGFVYNSILFFFHTANEFEPPSLLSSSPALATGTFPLFTCKKNPKKKGGKILPPPPPSFFLGGYFSGWFKRENSTIFRFHFLTIPSVVVTKKGGLVAFGITHSTPNRFNFCLVFSRSDAITKLFSPFWFAIGSQRN